MDGQIGSYRLAGFWRRAAGYLIDAIAMNVFGVILISVGEVVLGVGGAFWFILHGMQVEAHTDSISALGEQIVPIAGLIASAAYWTGFVHAGATPGMRLLGMKVVSDNGGKVSVGRAFLRWIAMSVSAATLLIGLIWVAWDEKKKGWHDHIAGTLVVMREVRKEHVAPAEITVPAPSDVAQSGS